MAIACGKTKKEKAEEKVDQGNQLNVELQQKMVALDSKGFLIRRYFSYPIITATCVKHSERSRLKKQLHEIADLSNMVEGLINRSDVKYEGDEKEFDRVESQAKVCLDKVDDLKDCEDSSSKK
jgi:hypothetical protein